MIEEQNRDETEDGNMEQYGAGVQCAKAATAGGLTVVVETNQKTQV